MARKRTCWIVSAVLLIALAQAASFAESLPIVRTTTFAASVPNQARIEVDAAGQILSVFNTTDESGVQPSILNVYQDGIKITITPEITQELDAISSKIDWRRGGVVYQREMDESISDVDVGPLKPGHIVSLPDPFAALATKLGWPTPEPELTLDWLAI
jgi:hypothetical protein